MLVSSSFFIYLLLIIQFSILSSSHDYQDPNHVYYLDWISLNDNQLVTTYENDVLLDIVSFTDDVPLQSVDIPFSFPYFGEIHKILFVNPNGALQLDSTSLTPCGTQFAGPPICTIENNYFGFIAGFFADLNPGSSNNSKILKSISEQNNTMKISYVDIPLYSHKNVTVEFQIELKSDGNIKINYLHYISSDLFQKNSIVTGAYNHYLIGVRPSQNNVNYFVQSDYQHSTQKLWSTSLIGVYPKKSLIASNTSFNLCPISLYWCITPNIIQRSQNSIIKISTINMSCIHQFTYKCSLTTFTSTLKSTQSIYIEATKLNNNSFSCNISSSIFIANTDIVTISVSLIGYFKDNNINKKNYVNGTETNHIYIMRTPLNLTVTSSAVSTTTNENCVTSWTSRPSTCNACSVCTQNFTCLSNIRTCGSNIYDTPSPCSGICTSQWSGNYHNYQIQDRAKQCCKVSELDCNNNCNGLAKITGHYSCVCNNDCLGVCGGNSTCAPTAMPTSSPKLVFSSPVIFANISYIKDMPIKSMGIFAKIYQLYNPNPFNLTVTSINITGSLQYDPLINITLHLPLVLKPSQHVDVSINVSFLRVLRGYKTNGWELKYIDFLYNNVIVNNNSISVSKVPRVLRVPVEVEVEGCSNISSKSICSNSPGCMYCVTYPNQRLLRDDIENDKYFFNDPSSSSSSSSSSIAHDNSDSEDPYSTNKDSVDIEDEVDLNDKRKYRLLYNNIVPSSIGDVVSSVEGYCTSGKTTASCSITIEDYGTDKSIVWIFGVVIVGTVSFCLCLFSY